MKKLRISPPEYRPGLPRTAALCAGAAAAGAAAAGAAEAAACAAAGAAAMKTGQMLLLILC